MLAMLVALWTASALQAPDTAKRARYANALHAVSDSLDRVRGAAAGFRLDLSHASRELVRARAHRMRQSCSGALRAAEQFDGVLASGPYEAAARTEQAHLRRELEQLRRALRQCQRDFDPGPRTESADSAQAWAPYRLSQLDPLLRRYDQAALGFKKKAGLR